MFKHVLLAALLAAGSVHAAEPAASPAKKELVKKLITLQQPGVEMLARSIVERPAMQIMQAAGQAIHTQVPQDKREAVAKSVEADVKKFVEDGVPALRERAVKVAPSVLAPVLESKFSEDELKQIIAWLESPVNKKYMQVAPELQTQLGQRLSTEAQGLLEPKLKALDQKVRAAVGAPPAPAASK